MDPGRGGICEETAFGKVFRLYAKTLRNYLYYRFGDEDTANDMAQEAFIKLWENCAEVPSEKVKSYLYTVANNKSLNQVAHKKVVLAHAKSAVFSGLHHESPDYLMEEEEFSLKLQKAIGSLTEAQRTAFLLNRIEGKKYVEIAAMLDISVKAVEKRISNALISLRMEIENMR